MGPARLRLRVALCCKGLHVSSSIYTYIYGPINSEKVAAAYTSSIPSMILVIIWCSRREAPVVFVGAKCKIHHAGYLYKNAETVISGKLIETSYFELYWVQEHAVPPSRLLLSVSGSDGRISIADASGNTMLLRWQRLTNLHHGCFQEPDVTKVAAMEESPSRMFLGTRRC